MNNHGYLIVFEGIDGSGKTTVAKEVLKKLSDAGYRTYYTYEPWESPFAKLLQSFKGNVNPLIEALLMAADRYFHIENDIKPKLKEGYIILLDRYYYSSIAYQGARGVNIEWIKELNKYVIKPNIILYLDVSPETALKRVGKKTSKWEYFEKKEILLKVKKIYEKLIKTEKFTVINAEAPLNEVIHKCFNIILSTLKNI